jgi:hypothetical protein
MHRNKRRAQVNRREQYRNSFQPAKYAVRTSAA